jgi:predicted nucleic acid-binding protein
LNADIAVTDANLVLALILPLPCSQQSFDCMDSFKTSGIKLFAPALWSYEIVSGLRWALHAKMLTAPECSAALGHIEALGIEEAPPNSELHRRALHWADQLGQSKAYDAQYLALAEALDCALWTTDQRLAQRCAQLNLDWVKSIE